MVDIAKIEKLMLLMSKYGVDVVQAESASEKFSLAKNASHSNIFQSHVHHSSSPSTSLSPSSSFASKNFLSENHGETPAAVTVEPPATAAVSIPKEEKALPAGETLTSPFVGTFYRSPSPDSPSFVDIGTKVKKGQALCIVEAMKLMNEIESEIEGEVVAILVDNAKPVEFGTPLFVIAPTK